MESSYEGGVSKKKDWSTNLADFCNKKNKQSARLAAGSVIGPFVDSETALSFPSSSRLSGCTECSGFLNYPPPFRKVPLLRKLKTPMEDLPFAKKIHDILKAFELDGEDE